jgi:large exoprotein involved in heme utilization and adhesion
LQGKNISLLGDSVALIQNRGIQAGGLINVVADNLELQSGTNGSIISSLEAHTLGIGASGRIEVVTQQLKLQDGAKIATRAFSPAAAGNITVNASQSIQVLDYNATDRSAGSGIVSTTFNAGEAGNVDVTTTDLTVRNGSSIASLTFGKGATGNVTVKAQEMQLIGMNPTFTPSSISAITLGTGDAKNVTVNTERLSLLQGGQINSSTLAIGNGGSVTVNATEFIRISGQIPGAVFPSLISASAEIPAPQTQQALRLPPLPSGASGNLSVQTDRLEITDQGKITVSNVGTGNAGNLLIQAQTIALNTRSGITASTASGEGGNIQVQVGNTLVMRNDSLISTEAKQQGSGGNLTLQAPLIVGLGNSDIIANASGGRGGRIDITTQGIIGLAFRNTTTPRTDPSNDISASSDIGLDGTVEIQNVGVDPNSGLVTLPVNLADPNQQIAKGCQANQGSSFARTGRGGIPTDPTQYPHSGNRNWADLRSLTPTPTISSQPTVLAPLLEASQWQRQPLTGQVELVAAVPQSSDLAVSCAKSIPGQ